MVEVEHALIAQKEEFQMRKVNLRKLNNSTYANSSNLIFRKVFNSVQRN